MSKPSAPSTPSVSSRIPFFLSLLALLVAIAASGMLVYKHYSHVALPGCGPQSDCDAAASSVFGSIPIPATNYKFPVSHLGLAYFVALFLGSLIARHAFTAYHHFVVRLGVFASLFFIIILIKQGHLCPYCLTAHAGNIAYWLLGEFSSSTSSASRAKLASKFATLAFLALVAGFSAVEISNQRAARLEQEKLAADSTQQIIDSAHPASQASTDTQSANQPLFTGRYRQGPASAPIRIVIFSDFQCPDCYRVEMELRALLKAHPNDISLSAKNFPMCAQCNPVAHGQCLHGNACACARIAEAAGLLRGNDGYWQMHDWLFDRHGSFDTVELQQGLISMGYDPTSFMSVAMTDQALVPVQEDCKEASSLGLFFTPFIFINGVEFRGWVTPNALATAVNTLLQSNLPARTAAADHPPLATEKMIGDWRENPYTNMPHLRVQYTLGPSRAIAPINVWSDYNQPGTVELDSAIRKFIADHPDRLINYTFHHYPFQKSCNPHIGVDSPLPPTGCLAARAAFAAGAVAGNDGYWRMHEWLLKNSAALTVDSLRAAAPSLKLDPDALITALDSPEVVAALTADINAGRSVNPKGFLPLVYVKDKWLPRWETPANDVLQKILDEASR
ncbi:MAG TPA: DsbA family protein [Phycisphaerales bacterium]|nr:DsbA family protein [Phycisphaerales bacterium]